MNSQPPAADPLDTVGMWSALRRMPELLADAVGQAQDLPGLPDRDELRNVLVLGMGPGGFVGDLLAVTAGPFMPLPIVVVKSFEPPAYANEQTLVFAISVTGDTPEILQAAAAAAEAGCRMVVVAGGGQLADMAARWDAPLVTMQQARISPHRAEQTALAAAPMVVLEDIGLFPGATQWILQAAGQLRRRCSDMDRPDRPAAELARHLGTTVPLIYGGHGLGGVAASFWKNSVNVNAKAPAFSATVPDLLHNEIAGWGQHGDVTRQVFSLVTLRHDYEHPLVTRGFEALADLMGEVVADVHRVDAAGEGPVAQMFDLMFQGAATSLEMAAAVGLDPGPIPAIIAAREALQS